MTEQDDGYVDEYDRRLGRELHALSARALHPFDAVAVAHEVAVAHRRAARRFPLDGLIPRVLPRPVLMAILATATLLVAVVGSSLVVGGAFTTPVATPWPSRTDLVFVHAIYDPARLERPANLAVYVLPGGGDQRRRLADVPGTVPWPVSGLVGPVAVPSPDGRRIAFRMFNDQPGIWLMNRDGSELHRVVDLPLDTAPSLPFLDALDWSPDSTRIAYTYPYSGRSAPLYVVDVEDDRVTSLTGDDPSRGATRAVAWSPDGSRIAFARTESYASMSMRGGGRDGLFVMNADGTGEVRLTYPRPDNVLPFLPAGNVRGLTWAPDGKRIAFIWESYGGPETTLKVVDADGTGLRDVSKLSVGGGCCFFEATDLRPLEWSPDGDRIVLVRSKGLDQAEGELETIMLIRADGSGEQELAKGSFFDVSPDGSRVVVAEARLDEDPGQYSIYVMNIDGTDKQWVEEGEFPMWAPAPRE